MEIKMPDIGKDGEEKFILIMRWIWRNLLASGVILVCFFFLYNKMNTVESDLKELKTIYEEHDKIGKLFMKRARGDYGFAAYAAPEPEFTSDEEASKYYDELHKKYDEATRMIDGYLDE